jgi:hypothetical protein
MATIDKLINVLNQVNPVDVTFDTLKQDTEAITKLNKQQLMRGEMSDGSRTPKHTYGSLSRLYVNDKLDSGKISSSTLPHVNLFDTGAFYRGFTTRFQRNNFSIFSRDSKSSELQDTYGNLIFGLQSESLDKLMLEKKTVIQGNYKKKIGV